VQEWVCNHHKHVERNPETNLITQWKYKRPKLVDKSNKKSEENRELSKQRRRLTSLKRRSISYDKQLLDYYRRMVNETYNDKYSHLFKSNKGEFENKFYQGILPSPIKMKNKHDTCIMSDNFDKNAKSRKIKSLNNNADDDILNSTPINDELKKSILNKVTQKKKHSRIVENDKVKLLNQNYQDFRKAGISAADSANIKYSSKSKQKKEKNDYENLGMKEKSQFKHKKAKFNMSQNDTIEFEESENELRALFLGKSNDYMDDSFITDTSMNSIQSFEEKTDTNSKVENKILNKSFKANNNAESTKASPNSLIDSSRTTANLYHSVTLENDKNELNDTFNSNNVELKTMFNENNYETIFESSNEKNLTSTESNIDINEECKKTIQKAANIDEFKPNVAIQPNKILKKTSHTCKQDVRVKSLIDKAIQSDDCEHSEKIKSSIKASSTQTIEKKNFYEEFKKNGTKRLINLPKLSKSHQDYSSIRKSTIGLRKKHTKSVDHMSYSSIVSNRKQDKIKESTISLVESICSSITSKEISDNNMNEILKQETTIMHIEENIESKSCYKEDVKISNEFIGEKHHSSREESSASSKKSVNIVKPFVIVTEASKLSNKNKLAKSNNKSDSLSTVSYAELDEKKSSDNKSTKNLSVKDKKFDFLNKCCCFSKSNENLTDKPKKKLKTIGSEVSSSDNEARVDEWIDSGKTKLGLKLERFRFFKI
jgi:hypothetical protein